MRKKNGPIFDERGLLDKELAMVWYAKGACDQEIADVCGVCYSAVGTWRRKENLPPHRKPNYRRPSQSMSKLSREAREARKAGMNYGVWKAQQWEAAGRPKYRRGA